MFRAEYLGFLPIGPAALALGDTTHQRLVVVFALRALLFLLLSVGGHTIFHFYELLHGLKIRAMGMMF